MPRRPCFARARYAVYRRKKELKKDLVLMGFFSLFVAHSLFRCGLLTRMVCRMLLAIIKSLLLGVVVPQDGEQVDRKGKS